jgi:hypothetical protein
MGWGKTFWVLLFLGGLYTAQGQAANGGLCSYDTSNSQNLPYATCVFPTCPIGANCCPPTIDKTTATIVYNEPTIQWNDQCPDTTVEGACWGVQMTFTLEVAATSTNGVAYIGVNLSQETNDQRIRKLYWGKTGTQDSSGRYVLDTSLIAYVPPGQRLMLEVHELCAQDNDNNEGCIIPLGSQVLSN